uniref:Uncharacterized protein n=1 Tax=Heterorhabditis bacteriophora TaxID=37862 RepID=A0A1I7WH74_HETBA
MALWFMLRCIVNNQLDMLLLFKNN